MEKRLITGLLLTLVVTAQVAPAQTRAIDVGRVTEVAALGRSGKCPLTRSGQPSADALRIVRGPPDREENAELRDTVFARDRLLARRFIDARIDINSLQLGTGTLSLIPELGRCAPPVSVGADTVLGISLVGDAPARYRLEVRRETLRGRPVDRLLFAVQHGGAVVSWDRNVNAAHPMSIIALGEEIRLTGTKVAVMVDSTARRALFFVAEGSVAVVGFDALQITRGSVVQLRAGQPPQLVGPVSRELVREIAYHSTQVFAPPGLRPWQKIGIGVASVGVGFAAYRIIAGGNGSATPQGRIVRNRTGNIVIRIPL